MLILMGDGRAYFFTTVKFYLVTIYLYKFEHYHIHHEHVTLVWHVIYCTYGYTLTKGKVFYSTSSKVSYGYCCPNLK